MNILSQKNGKKTFKSQWEHKVKPTKRPEARENASNQVGISFCFTSDWLRKWRKVCGPITEQSKAKLKQF